MLNAYKYLEVRCQKEGARLFSVVPSNRMTNNGHKIKHMKSCFNIRKNIFTMGVAEQWDKLPNKVVESLSGDIQNPP